VNAESLEIEALTENGNHHKSKKRYQKWLIVGLLIAGASCLCFGSNEIVQSPDLKDLKNEPINHLGASPIML